MINFHSINAQNQSQFLELLEENPMQGWVSTVMTRQPDYLKGLDYFGKERGYLAEKEGQSVGCYQLTTHQGFVNGQPTELGYLNSLRVNTHYRHKISVLKAGFKHLQQQGHLPFYCYTSIASANHVARRLLEKGLDGLPHYHCIGELYTLIIAKRRARHSGVWQPVLDIERWNSFYNRQASQYQLSPCLDTQWLADSQLIPMGYKQNNQLKACAILWSQHNFKQVKVTHYHPLIALLRPLYNVHRFLTKRPSLPRLNCALSQSFLAFFHATDNQPLVPLIEDALYHCQTPLLTLSLTDTNPQLPEIIKNFKPFIYKTRIYRVDFSKAPLWQPRTFNLEAAIL